ncbi:MULTISPECIES: hypothetical protein [Streptomyces]|uniref:hypothetical protein n=1 Tax=Streptomyces TaxID=1883 RepID=UPI00099D913D|nr:MULTISPECIES: hypothetical protein [Streptomyces]RZE84490.1 hypothetical protein C0Q99_01560 [Streptomyces albidoflavus]
MSFHIPTVPAPSGAPCCRCKRWTYAPVAVRWIPAASGPGHTLYACPSHAAGLIPGPLPGELERGM